MRTAYGDLISGISGDMFVGSLLDLRLPLAKLRVDLGKVRPLTFKLAVGKKKVNGITATRFRVLTAKREAERTWKEIRRLIESSRLESEVKDLSLKVFARLAEVEGKIHGTPPEKVHFHEVGATDSIVDILAACIGVRFFNIGSFHFSPVPLGRGLVSSRHGVLPGPAPATLELLKGIPVQWTELEGETVTPTGAALLSVLGASFGEAPAMTVSGVGYGAGERTFPDRPNLFRVVLGEEESVWEKDEMVVLETNVDDMNPELYDYAMERLFAGGARDVFLTPIQMKKNRPGTLLRVIAEASRKDKLAEILFRETSTIGIRYYAVKRMTLKRTVVRVKTKFGAVSLKLVEEPGGEKRAVPEYDDCKEIAKAKRVPLKVVYEEAVRSFAARTGAKKG